jgi:hypothetical protein
MTTMFKLVCDSCGLSLREAPQFLGAKLDTAKSWSSGRNPAPETVIDELIELAVRIDVAAREGLLRIKESRAGQGLPEKIEIGIAADDAEAQSLGWPCAGTHHAVIRNLIELAPDDIKHRLVIVPRGSTPATAAAADAHGQ